MNSRLLRGGCHCGKVQIEFGTAIAPADFAPRACDCSFCLKHGASYISDPDGSLSIQAKGLDSVSEYRQGSEGARFIVCRRCGVLVAVVFDDDGASYGAVNTRCIEEGVVFGAPQVVSPQRLGGEEKKRRWAKLWTPMRVPSA
jgi:hypothetical protein